MPRQAVKSFCTGHDVFVCLPTGYGKSYCFVLLPLVFDRVLGRDGSIVLCVSPLTSLMMEQRSKYTTQGVCSEFAIQPPMEGDASASCVSGESGGTCSGRSTLHNDVVCFKNSTLRLSYPYMKSEYICFFNRGDDFRTDYGRPGELRALLPPSVHVMALTATATRSSRDKIFHSCQLSYGRLRDRRARNVTTPHN